MTKREIFKEMQGIEERIKAALVEYIGKPMTKETLQEIEIALTTIIGQICAEKSAEADPALLVKFDNDHKGLKVIPGNLWTLCVLNGCFPPFAALPEFGEFEDPRTGIVYGLDQSGACVVELPQEMKLKDTDEIQIAYKNGGTLKTTIGKIRQKFRAHPTEVRQNFFDLLRYEGKAANDYGVYILTKHPFNNE